MRGISNYLFYVTTRHNPQIMEMEKRQREMEQQHGSRDFDKHVGSRLRAVNFDRPPAELPDNYVDPADAKGRRTPGGSGR